MMDTIASEGVTGIAGARTVRCSACSGALRVERSLFDDRYGYPGGYRLLRCEACGQLLLDVQMTSDEVSDMYTRYYPRSTFDVENWNPPGEMGTFTTWFRGLQSSAFRWVPRNVRVLDIGCGFGESLGYHRARGCKAQGVEADRNILRVAERHSLDVKVGLFDAINYEPETFDVVTLDQVIEHVADPISLLQGVHRVLKPSGMLVLSTPNANGWGAKVFGSRWIHWHAPYHVQFFSKRSMARSAERAGFVLEQVKTVTNSAWLDFQWGHLVTYAGVGRPSPYWNASLPRSITQRVLLKLLLIVDRLGINAILTRLADALGVGDNAVYLLRKPAH